jgi:predicted enzyme related to lactoylglutathione lyase
VSSRDIAWAAVTIDCVEPPRVAAFWSELLGVAAAPVGADRPGWIRLGPAVPGGPVVNFQPVAEPKAGKARIHLDLWVADLDAAIARAVALGGRQVGELQVLERGTIAVMADPEGNELCLLAAPAAG